MSILINMEMPKNCLECPLNCTFYLSHLAEIETQFDSCPLIEVPKHGRLIEDTVLDTMSMWNTDREYDRGWDSAVQAARNRIKSAPTIIEAEEKDG